MINKGENTLAVENAVSKKIRIAICDDEPIFLKLLADALKEVLVEEKISYLLQKFVSGCELLEQIEKCDLVFLDIDMPQMDGIEIGLKIQKKNPNCRVIMASGREDRFKETYKISPLRFISKPFDKEEIQEAIQAYINQWVGMQKIEVFRERKSYWIYQKDIQYIAAYRSNVEIYVNNVLYRKDIALNGIEEQLDSRCFFKVHKSYIVNLFWVTEYEEKNIWIEKIKLPLSRRQQKNFEQAYVDFNIKYR